ncbi:MAG: TolC family protein, partial [[Clostridium] fimetarium]|nr:TolC family protein [[Clostridium] fimetarium]
MKFLIPVTICAALGAAPAFAADDMEAVVGLVVKHDSGLHAELANLAAEVSEAKAANMLADPEVEGELLFPQGGGKNRWSVGLTQGFDWPGAYRARGRVADATAELNGAKFDELLHEARYEARCSIIQLIAANKDAATLEEISASMDELQAKYKRAWENGEATILDVNKLAVEAA